MNTPDWIVLVVTLTGIVLYGLYKSRTSKNLEGYFLSNRNMSWWLVLLSIMGTQASAITFLSTPGQAFTDGMRFVQNYFGLPLAMIVISISFVPVYNRLKIFTAYEFLEERFDIKTRTFTSAMFLLSRGLSTGISVYAPSIILSSLLGWDIFWTNIVMGGILIIYTMSGGAKAVAYTQQLQLVIIFTAMFIAGYYIVHNMPANVSFTDALKVSGASGKLNVITTGIDENGFAWKDRFNIINGLIGGFFLQLSYFGTDQSQVGRYLTAKNNTESKMGLLMNGLVKIPMQFLILLLGALLFTYYQFNSGPIFFNSAVDEKVYTTKYGDSLRLLENEFSVVNGQQAKISAAYLEANNSNAQENTQLFKDSLNKVNGQVNTIRNEYKVLLKKADPSLDTNDTNYIFLRFVVDTLPAGLVGLLIAVIFLASWGSIAAALNSLASCTMIDFYCRFKKHQPHVKQSDIVELNQYKLSKWFTLGWGIFCIIVAEFSTNMGSLIQAVNEYGSLFYGVILGIFLVAFYMKKINGNPVFYGAIISEVLVVTVYILDKSGVIGFSFLWLNVLGALAVVILSWLIQKFYKAA
jgi:solute:Na+ symporter, SSS family